MKLRILILGGGSGDVGRDLTRILVKNHSAIEKITVTSTKTEVAQKFIQELNDPRLSSLQLNVMDKEKLLAAFKNQDMIVNTVGPFVKYGIPVMKAAIKSRVNYIDICDDIEPTLEAIQLDVFAKDAGVFLLLSMGWFPGMSNLHAKALADQMDEVEEIVTAWVTGRKSPEQIPSKGLGGIEHFYKAQIGKILSFRHGRRCQIPAHQPGVTLPFIEPLGPYECYQIEHPETATLPYIIPGVKTATNLGSLYPKQRNRASRFTIRLMDLKLISLSFGTSLTGMSMQSKRKVNLPQLNASYIACIGTKDGKKGQLSYSEVNQAVTCAEATSQPLACAIHYIVSGGTIAPGVHLPETALKLEDILTLGRQYRLPFVTEAKHQTQWSDTWISLAK